MSTARFAPKATQPPHHTVITRRRLVGLGAVGAATAIAAQLGQTVASAEPRRDGQPPLVGSWRLLITLKLPSGPVQVGASVMFAAGGGVIDAPAEPVPTGIGTWRQDAEREFRWTLTRFQIDNSGNLIGETRVFETDIVDPSGETYQGTSVIKGFDLNGVQQFSLMATVHGTRMEIDP